MMPFNCPLALNYTKKFSTKLDTSEKHSHILEADNQKESQRQNTKNHFKDLEDTKSQYGSCAYITHRLISIHSPLSFIQN